MRGFALVGSYLGRAIIVGVEPKNFTKTFITGIIELIYDIEWEKKKKKRKK